MKEGKIKTPTKKINKQPSRKKQLKKGGGYIDDITYQCDLVFNNANITVTNKKGFADTTNSTFSSLRYIIMDHILPAAVENKTTETNIIVNKNTGVIHNFLNQISFKHDGEDMFADITTIVKQYGEVRSVDLKDNNKSNNENVNFQSNYFEVVGKKQGTNKDITIYKDIFGKYEIYNKEDERKFVTIDPSIIQIMIFDDNDPDDIVYSLKLIYRTTNTITLRYTTKLFPNNSKINDFNDLTNFNNFNTTLGNKTIDEKYHNLQLLKFLKKYIKFYNFYRKCYTFNKQDCPPPADSAANSAASLPPPATRKLIEYQLKYISILGKARFGDPIIQVRTATITDYIMSNLLFASPSYAFISGGYKGFKDNKYGVTRSGYEISKRYNRPILTIMCAEGQHDAHEFSDATLIYGEHWGEDSIALSQLTDGAIIIAPFGGWTYIECLTLLANRKIVGIYNDFFNILNYDGKNDNANFFKFTITEQKNIINYNINYYLILLYLLNNENFKKSDFETEITNFKNCLEFGVKLLLYLKVLLENVGPKYQPVKDAEYEYNKIKNTKARTSDAIRQKRINKEAADVNIKEAQNDFSKDLDVKHLVEIITNFNTLKSTIDYYIKKYLANINNVYKIYINQSDSNYQNKIPEKCDGIWIKPIFDLITRCIPDSNKITQKLGGGCSITDRDVGIILHKITINFDNLNEYDLFKSLNTNIIFVFSDVMYLNIYLNEYLNTPSFQQYIQTKISYLLTLQFTTLESKKNDTLKNIIDEEKNYELILDRNIDGTLDEATKTITNESKIRQNYTFKINSDCNNYTNLIDILSSAELPEGPSANTMLDIENTEKYKKGYENILDTDRILLNKLLDADNHIDPIRRVLVRSKTNRIIRTQEESLFSRSATMKQLMTGKDNDIEEAPEAAQVARGGGVRRKNKY